MRKGIQFHNQIALQLAPNGDLWQIAKSTEIGEIGGKGRQGICVKVDWLNLFIVGSNITLSCSKMQQTAGRSIWLSCLRKIMSEHRVCGCVFHELGRSWKAMAPAQTTEVGYKWISLVLCTNANRIQEYFYCLLEQARWTVRGR